MKGFPWSNRRWQSQKVTRANNKSLLWEHATFIFFGMMTHILRAENFHFFHGFGVLWVLFFQGWRFKVGSHLKQQFGIVTLFIRRTSPHLFFFSDSDCSTFLWHDRFDMFLFKATNAQQREKVRENGKLKPFGNAMVGNWKGQKKCNVSLFNHVGLESRWRR